MRIFGLLNSLIKGMSGSDNRFIEIFKRIKGKGVRVYIITSNGGKRTCIENGLDANFKITTKENDVEGNIVLFYLKRMLSALDLKVKLNEGDILYSSSDILPDIFPAFMLKLMNKDKNVKWIAFFHLIAPNPFYGYEQKNNRKKRLKLVPRLNDFLYKINQLVSIYLMKLQADVISVDNSVMKKYLEEKNISSDMIISHKNGVDLHYIQGVQKADYKKFDGIFLGRLHPQKGVFDLIKIWEGVCEGKPMAKLGVIGGGEKHYEKKIKNTVKEKEMDDNIEFLGFKMGDEKFSLLKSSKVFIFPSYYESFGQVILEAMACGLPVVAYDLSPYKEFFNHGLVTVPKGNIPEFSQKVLELLNNPKSAEILGKQGKALSKKYDWDEIAEEEIEILEKIRDDFYNSN